MSNEIKRAEIIVGGLVQGVGFRYFVFRNAEKLGLKGFVRNLYSGEVQTVVEGEKVLIEEFFKMLRVGPSHAQVNKYRIEWQEPEDEFTRFEVRY